MSYFPLKCPFCLQRHSNDTVLFNPFLGVEIGRRKVKSESGNAENNFLLSGDDDMQAENNNWQDEESNSKQNRVSKIAVNPLEDNDYYDIEQLTEKYGEDNILVTYKNEFIINSEISEYDLYDGQLVESVVITTIINDMEIDVQCRRRFCDCNINSQPREFFAISGTVPSYVVLLMGSSSSGKTTFLTSLYHDLSNEGGYKLPPKSAAPLAKLSMKVLTGRLEKHSETSISNLSDMLFNEGALPKSTNDLYNEPLTLDLTISMPNKIRHQALFFLRDIPGEYLTDPDKYDEIEKILHQFNAFDGFVMMFDPLTFTSGVFSDELDMNDSRAQHAQLNNIIELVTQTISPLFDRNVIKKPTVALITKGDKFFDKQNNALLAERKIERNLPILALGQIKSFDRPYFDEVNRNVKYIISRLSSRINSLMEDSFYSEDIIYSLVAALSKDPIDIDYENRRVLTPSALDPWNVSEPILRLLMKLKILPPFDKTLSYDRQDDTNREDRLVATKSVINKWGRECCVEWIDYPNSSPLKKPVQGKFVLGKIRK